MPKLTRRIRPPHRTSSQPRSCRRLPLALSVTGPQTVAGTKPAIVLKTGNLGKVLATPARFGIYYWSVEKKAGGKIRCTGAVRGRLATRVRQGDGAEAHQGSRGDLRDDQARHEAPAHDQRAPRLHVPP